MPPTLLDAAGLSVPVHMQGRSLIPLLQKKQSINWPEEVFIQISESQVGRAIRTKRWKYVVHAPNKDPHVDSGSDRYQELYLYDLKADPYELKNLMGVEKYKEVTEELKKRLIRRMEEAGEQAPIIEAFPIETSTKRTIANEQFYEDYWHYHPQKHKYSIF